MTRLKSSRASVQPLFLVLALVSAFCAPLLAHAECPEEAVSLCKVADDPALCQHAICSRASDAVRGRSLSEGSSRTSDLLTSLAVEAAEAEVRGLRGQVAALEADTDSGKPERLVARDCIDQLDMASNYLVKAYESLRSNDEPEGQAHWVSAALALTSQCTAALTAASAPVTPSVKLAISGVTASSAAFNGEDGAGLTAATGAATGASAMATVSRSMSTGLGKECKDYIANALSVVASLRGVEDDDDDDGEEPPELAAESAGRKALEREQGSTDRIPEMETISEDMAAVIAEFGGSAEEVENVRRGGRKLIGGKINRRAERLLRGMGVSSATAGTSASDTKGRPDWVDDNEERQLRELQHFMRHHYRILRELFPSNFSQHWEANRGRTLVVPTPPALNAAIISQLEVTPSSAPLANTAAVTVPGPVPKATPKAVPKVAPSTVPKTAPKTAPKTVPKTAPKITPNVPATAPKTIPATTPKTVPATAPKTVPATVPKTVPATAPKTVPATVPKTVPATAPKTVPATAPKTLSKTAPKAAPKVAPKTLPKASPATLPRTAPKTVPKVPLKTAPKTPTTASPKVAPKTAPKTLPKAAPGIKAPVAGPGVAVESVPSAHPQMNVFTASATLKLPSLRPDYVVSKDGQSGHYDTVQKVMDELKMTMLENRRKVIFITKGVYKEKVTLRKDRIIFLGEGPRLTKIAFDDSPAKGSTVFDSASVGINANEFTAMGITFLNTAGPRAGQAIALRCEGDKSAFYDCLFLGNQDTLAPNVGRQFFKNVGVLGSIDFVFGVASAVFEDCTFVMRRPLPGYQGCVSAQGRDKKKDPSAFVFLRGRVIGESAGTYGFLGRPWWAFSRSIFVSVYLGPVIGPGGWLEWDYGGGKKTTWGGKPYLAEYGSYGPGSKGARVAWAKPGKIPYRQTWRYYPSRLLDLNSWVAPARRDSYGTSASAREPEAARHAMGHSNSLGGLSNLGGLASDRVGGGRRASDLPPPPVEEVSLQAPFPSSWLASGLSSDDLRECAYELLVNVVGPKPAPVNRNAAAARKQQNKGIISDEMKAVLRLKAGSEPGKDGAAALTPLDVVRRQLDISEACDERTRAALIRAHASAKKPENLVVPLELLCQLNFADFPSQRDYSRWKRRQLMLLDQATARHPGRAALSSSASSATPPPKGYNRDKADSAMRQLKQLIAELTSGQRDMQETAARQALRNAVTTVVDMPLASGGKGGGLPAEGRWADGWPLNVRLYATLLGSVFTGLQAATLVEELEEVLEILGKVWPVLGITPLVHRCVFAWLFLKHYVSSGQKEPALLVAADFQLRAVETEVKNELGKSTEQQQQEQVLVLLTLLPHMVKYGEPRLLAYHDEFPDGGPAFESTAGLMLRADELLQSEEVVAAAQRAASAGVKLPGSGSAKAGSSVGPKRRADQFVRSSVKKAFSAVREAAAQRQVTLKQAHGGVPPLLVALAAESSMLAVDSVGRYAAALRPWNSNAGGLTVAMVHSCYKNELKLFIADRTVLSVEMTQVLLQAEKLEKQLIEMAVEEGADAEDGGAEVIQEMPPYETQRTIEVMLQQWQDNRIAKCAEWVDRAIQLEKWEPKAMKAFCASSVMDVLGLLDETQEAFFALPLPPRADMLVSVVRAMEAALLKYCKAVTAHVGDKSQFLPPFPPLTRYKEGGAQEKGAAILAAAAATAAANGTNGSSRGGGGKDSKSDRYAVPRLLVRINTLFHIHNEVDALAARIRSAWERAMAPSASSPSTAAPVQKSFWPLPSFKKVETNVPLVPPLPSELICMFDDVRHESETAMAHLCQFVAYRVVCHELKDVAVDALYAGGPATRMRIAAVLERLHPHLVVIADIINDGLRDRVVLEVLRALVHCYLRALLAGGPARSFTVPEVPALKEDLSFLSELFIDGGDGLPADKVQAALAPAASIVTLMSRDTDDIIRKFDAAYKEFLRTVPGGGAGGKDAKGNLVLPPVPEEWCPSDANTLLRVLCYRGDRRSSKHLKKVFDLPKELKKPWY
ncbi:unnamed protein product [Closterium sp. NIES-64]|nr:unnamed protein product [Closterium sp. NIES-64]CAI6008509.1 unnamed protein product [Closterium sp. NIES-65]